MKTTLQSKHALNKLFFSIIFLFLISNAGWSHSPEINESVALASFNAVSQDSKIALTWTARSDAKINYFELEKSSDGEKFSSIALIFPDENNSALINYAYKDNISKNISATNYYRLKLVYSDNKFTYSETRTILVPAKSKKEKLKIYPNPVRSEFRVVLPSAWQHKKVNFEIRDVNGNLIRNIERSDSGKSQLISIKDMKRGAYFLYATVDNDIAEGRILRK